MRRLKKFLANNRVTHSLYLKLYAIKYRKQCQKTRAVIQKQGFEIIGILQSVLEQLDITFFFDMGTLLGIVREGKLLGHDLDIDTAVIVETDDDIEMVTEKLIQNECVHKYRYIVDGIGIVEDSFIIKGVKFDVNYYQHNGENDICYLGYKKDNQNYEEGTMNVVSLTCPRVSDVVKIQVNGKSINIPSNPEQYLANRYGDNWRVPDKNYIYWRGPSASPIDNMCKQIIYK